MAFTRTNPRACFARLTAMAVLAMGLASAWGQANRPAQPAAGGEVSNYIYGDGDGWSLPSQTARRLAQKHDEKQLQDEAKARQEAASLAAAMAEARPNAAVKPVEAPAFVPPVDDTAWHTAQLALAMLAGIGVAALWNHFRQRRYASMASGAPRIISVGLPGMAMVGRVAAMPSAPAPRVPPRSRSRRNSARVMRRGRLIERRRDPLNEQIRSLAHMGVLPKWFKDLSPVLTDGARLAGAVTDDVQMYQMGGDAVPNYAYILDPKGMAVSAQRQRDASSMVWSNQNWQSQH
jgi:hypothetical protein